MAHKKRARRALKILRGVKKFSRKHKLIKHAKEYGPTVAGTAITLGGYAAAVGTANPAWAAAGQIAGGAVTSMGNAAFAPSGRNDSSHNTGARPTGSSH